MTVHVHKLNWRQDSHTAFMIEAMILGFLMKRKRVLLLLPVEAECVSYRNEVALRLKRYPDDVLQIRSFTAYDPKSLHNCDVVIMDNVLRMTMSEGCPVEIVKRRLITRTEDADVFAFY